eukprot:6213572-Pleurochrysis_carterae.AAC.2
MPSWKGGASKSSASFALWINQLGLGLVFKFNLGHGGYGLHPNHLASPHQLQRLLRAVSKKR